MTDFENGLVLHLPLNEGSGLKVFDRSRYQSHGVINPVVVWTDGNFGKALDFDGTQGWITIPDVATLDLTEMTFSFWIKPSVVTGARDIIDKSNGAVRNYRVNTNGSAMRAEFHDAGDVRHLWESSGLVLSTSVFQHIGITIRNGTIEIYRNGVKYSGSWLIGDGVGVPKINADPLYICFPVGNWFDGIIENVRFYNRILSPEEMRTLYLKEASDRDSGLMLDLEMNDGSGITAWDKTKNQNHGTLVGAGGLPTWVNGHSGKAVSFDGIDDTISIPDSVSLNPTEISIAFWISHTATEATAIRRVASKRKSVGVGLGGWEVFYDNGAHLLSFTRYINGAYDEIANAPIVLTDGVFYHVVCTYDGTNLRVYVNGLCGVPVASVAFPVNTEILYIGNHSSLDRGIDAVIDQFRIYNRALSLEEVRTLYLKAF